jgi:hypothetical protein
MALEEFTPALIPPRLKPQREQCWNNWTLRTRSMPTVRKYGERTW